MGHEINLEAGNRLNLRDAVALSHSYFLMLKAAFEQRSSQVGGAAVMLDSVVEIEGGLIVESLTARRPDARFQPG
jgi:hypothetical protein